MIKRKEENDVELYAILYEYFVVVVCVVVFIIHFKKINKIRFDFKSENYVFEYRLE